MALFLSRSARALAQSRTHTTTLANAHANAHANTQRGAYVDTHTCRHTHSRASEAHAQADNLRAPFFC
eukprot:2864386-Pleurochrysis_carterae.AAC.1